MIYDIELVIISVIGTILVTIPIVNVYKHRAEKMQRMAETILKQDLKLRESHALRKTIIDNLQIGVIVISSDYQIVALNKPFCRIFQIDEPLRQLVGSPIYKYNEFFFTNLEDKQIVREMVLLKKPFEDEQELNHRVLKRTYIPFYMDDEFMGHLFTIEDITERKSMEKSIIVSKEEAEKANLAKSMFLSQMSHELRTPLNGILGFSQLLELESLLTKQQQQFVQEILKGGRHLLSLINEILDLSRIETGKLKISNKFVKLGALIEECVNLSRPASANKGVNIFIESLPCDGNYVRADPIRLKQVILNLLDNAIKYNQENGVVSISCEQINESVYIHIIDNGIGITLEEQNRIFEPFYRIGQVSIEGTGIGLPLVKQLVQLMGGTVGVDSWAGAGSNFWISFPIVHSDDVELVLPVVTKRVLLPKVKQKKVLYIEDNLSNLQLVSEILSMSEEITLLSAVNGLDGIQMANDHKIDLIMLDMNLPDLPGIDVFEKLKAGEKTKDIPFIALSANATPDDKDKALAKGFKEYITKPIEINSFLKVISTYLAKQKA